MFELHPQLAKDCVRLGRFELCLLLLMNDRQYPWFILVPQVEGISEIFQLSSAAQTRMWHESTRLAQNLARQFAADKMNIAALGNVVPQLHVHHIVRYRTDPAWPAPVWGKFAPIPYSENELEQMMIKLKPALGTDFQLAQDI